MANFMSHMNKIQTILEFTLTKEIEEICSLDVKVVKQGGLLKTKLFSKPTDRNNILHKKSFYAPQVFGGIPRGQMMRASMGVMIEKCTKRGYDTTKLIETGKEIANMNKEELRQSKKKDNIGELLYVSTYDTHASLVKKAIHLGTSFRMWVGYLENLPNLSLKKGKRW